MLQHEGYRRLIEGQGSSISMCKISFLSVVVLALVLLIGWHVGVD